MGRYWKPFAACIGGMVVTVNVAAAQGTGRITGTVTDAAQSTPLPNVTVGVVSGPAGNAAGATLGARTNADGRYTIGALAAGRYILRAQLIGRQSRTDTVQVAAGQTVTLNFALRAATVSLEQVVVVGYGTQRRSDLTGAVASVTPQVERTPITSVEQTLQGTAPGVQVTQASSAPGGGISIRIRGASSITGNGEPLYVIDGFPVENDPSTTGNVTNGGRDNTAPANPLATLNPQDIQSIEVLKDASATSIYGARGANGVVIITTKRGQAGAPRVTVDAYTGSQNVAKRYDMLDATEYAHFANDWAAAAGQTAPFANPDTLGTGTDWQSAIFRTAPIYNLQLGVTGGTSGNNATRYALSGGTFQQQGVVRGSDFNRISLRGNIDQQVGSRLRVSSNVLVSRVRSAQVPTDGSFNSGAGAVGAALQYIPILPVQKADGSYTFLQPDFPSYLSSIGVNTGNVPNPVSQAIEVQDRLGDTRLLANAAGEYTILPGLRFRTSVGSDLSNRTRDTYYPRTTLTGLNNNGRAIRGQQQATSFLNENTLSYTRDFAGIHHVDAVAGYTRQSQDYTRTAEANSNFVSDITGYENIGAGTVFAAPTSGHTRYTLASYLGRVNYTLRDRYLFTVTGREDGSSRFGAGHRWGFFPSGAIGWRVSEEPFLKGIAALDQLKLRASYGVAGNPSIQPYQSLTRLAAQQYSFNGTVAAGYYPSSIGNPNLQWESSKQADVGLDLGLYQDRVNFTADYYNKRTDDLLLAIDLPSESGFSTALVNAGSISNKGLELSLTLRPVTGGGRKGAFSWTTTFNYANNKNRVLDLGGPSRIFASQSIAPDLGTPGTVVQVGQPIGAFFGYKTSGIFRDSTEVAEYTRTTRLSSGTISPGQVRIVDVNGDGVIDANDRTIIGDPNPRFTGGWQNTLSFRGFELSALFDAQQGNKVLNLNLYRTDGASPGTNVSHDRYYNAWTPSNRNASQPRLNSTPTAIGADFTDRVLEDGSFLRLRTVTLSRELPLGILGAAFRSVHSARLYVTGQNLVTFTNYSGFNPDVSSLGVGNLNRGIDIGAYPLARTVIVGINLSY